MTKLEETRAKLGDLYLDAIEIIETSVSDPVTVVDLCNVLNCSISRLNRAFALMSDKSPMQHIIENRQVRMFELVTTTNMNNRQMSEELCISRNTLLHQFKLHTGMTITEYRRRHPMLKQGGEL